MTMPRLIVGLDLGGTNVRGVLSDEDGNFACRIKEKVNFSSKKSLIQQLVRIVRSLCKSGATRPSNLLGVGVASTGPMDMKKGKLIHPTNIPFREVEIVKPIRKMLDVPVYLLNDCNAAVLGEKEYGAGKSHDNLVYIAIGTGIGGGAIVDGHLLLGKDGNAAEVGHFTVDPEGRLRCSCGKRGHWEAYCSGKNIPNYLMLRAGELKVHLERMETPEVFKGARSGNWLLARLVDEIGRFNAMGVANVVDAYDPSLVTMGGSIVLRDEDLVLRPIRRMVKMFTRNRAPKIRTTPLGEDVGLYGAVAAVSRHEEIFKRWVK